MSHYTRRLNLLPVLFVALGCQLVGTARIRDLKENEARELIAAGLGIDVSHLSLDPFKLKDSSNFFAYTVLTKNETAGVSPVIGNFAVNRITGDVWELVVCRRITNAAVKRLQEDLQKRIRIGGEEIRRLGASAPCTP